MARAHQIVFAVPLAAIVAVAGLVAIFAIFATGVSRAAPRAGQGKARFEVVVIDPGHGGADFGGRGVSGVREKDVVLAVSRLAGRELEKLGLRIVYTREEDRFVSLSERTEIANRARGDLFLSIHANTAPNPDALGSETYFLSLDASDDEARRVALVENGVFDQAAAAPDGADIVGGILGDLIRTRYLRDSSAIAASIQRNLASLPGPSRGVKQAPFVVLMGVNMPAALLEVGFLTNTQEAKRLQTADHRSAIARAIGAAVEAYGRERGAAPQGSIARDEVLFGDAR